MEREPPSSDDIDFLIMRLFASNAWRKPAYRVEQLEYLLDIGRQAHSTEEKSLGG